MPTYNRPKRKKRGSWDWERAAQGGISGAAYGFKAGGPKGAAIGALIGGGAGGLTGRDTSIDRAPYEEALDHYGIGRRKSARQSANELAAQTGAALTTRGVNNSALAAGVVSANRGRIMTAAESDIGKMRADIYASIAEAERQAESAYDAETRQGWLNLDQQLGFQALTGDFEGILGKGGGGDGIHPDDPFPELRNPDLQEAPNVPFDPDAASTDDPFPELRSPDGEIRSNLIGNRDRGLSPSPIEQAPGVPALPNPDTIDGGPAGTDDPFPELRVRGERSDPGVTDAWRRAKRGSTSVPPKEQDWLWEGGESRDTSPGRKRALEEVLDPEDMAALEDIMDVGAILSEAPRHEPPIRDTSPGRMRELDPPVYTPKKPRLPKGKIPIKSAAGIITGWADAPDTSSGRKRQIEEGEPYVSPDEIRERGGGSTDTSSGRMRELDPRVPPPSIDDANEDEIINVTPIEVESEWVTPAKMGALPGYFGYIYEDEQGFNPDDPSYAGITQRTYTEWRNREGMWGAPEDVKDLATRPEVISIFYEDYLADANVPTNFMKTPALEYMYVDFAIHGGHSGARRIYQRAIKSLRAQGITHPTDQQLLNAFNREKRNFYELQGTNRGAFLERADKVYSRSMRMMGGGS